MMRIIDLILDIRIKIASYDKNAFYLMYRYDDEFKKYAHTTEGIEAYESLFIIKNTLPYSGIYYYCLSGIFDGRYDGRPHSAFDIHTIIYKNGIKVWYKYGREHRAYDRPAVVYPNGKMEWYFNGKRHRANGKPAVIWHDGSEEYWIDGVLISHSFK